MPLNCGVIKKTSLYMAHIKRDELISWLDALEQKPFSRVAPIDETVEAFDPLYRGFVPEDYVFLLE